MKNTITKSLQDIFSPEVLKFVLKIGSVSVLLTGVFIYFFWGALSGFITSYLSWIPWQWLQTTGASVATIALAYMLIIIAISILTSLYVEPLLKKLAKKHYPQINVVGSPNIATSVYLSIKSGLIFLFIFMFTFPIIFIPIVGQVYMLWLWSILLKAPTVYDVSSLFISDKQTIKEKTRKSTLIAMIASLFNYVPVLNIFAPVFAQILFLHHILGKEIHEEA
jgi:MFS family permease